MTKEMLVEKLNAIVDERNSHDNGYHYEAVISDWQKYGKDRTYMAYVETRDGSKHYKKVSYGFYDNVNDKYFAEKYADLER